MQKIKSCPECGSLVLQKRLLSVEQIASIDTPYQGSPTIINLVTGERIISEQPDAMDVIDICLEAHLRRTQ